MKQITEKQIKAIQKLARITKTEIKGIERMSSAEASKIISALIEKVNQAKGGSKFQSNPRKPGNDYSSDALAGLAVKILAQRSKVEEIINDESRFRKRVVELYKVFSSARQACFA